MKSLRGKFISDLRKIREALLLRRGGSAQAWEYQVSHQWLTIRLEKPGLAGNFHLRCGGCERVYFETWWEPTDIEVEKTENGYIIHDGSHLRVECGLVVGEYNAPPVFDME